MTDDGMLELEALAEVRARIDFGASLHAALADAGLSREQWFRAQEQWGDALAESLDGDASLFVRHELAMAEARERLGPRVAPIDADLEAWLGFERGFQTAKDPAGFVTAAGITMRELGTLHARWSKRMLDPEVAARAAELRAADALPVPKLRREPLTEAPRALAPSPPPQPAPNAKSFLAPLPGAATSAPPAAPTPPLPERPRVDPKAEAQPSYLRQPAPPAPTFTAAPAFAPTTPASAPPPQPAAKLPLQGTSLALDLSAILRPALPFAAPTSQAPAAPPPRTPAAPATPATPAAPAAPAPSKKLGVMNQTSVFDASALMAAALPFHKETAQPPAPQAPAPPVALQAYAAFVVEAQAQREPLEALLARHGLTHAIVQQAERYYADAASRDPAVLAAWSSACAANRARLGFG